MSSGVWRSLSQAEDHARLQALKAFGLIAQRVALDERCGDTYPLLQEHKAEQAMRTWARLPTLADRHQAVVTYGRYKVSLSREVQAVLEAARGVGLQARSAVPFQVALSSDRQVQLGHQCTSSGVWRLPAW